MGNPNYFIALLLGLIFFVFSLKIIQRIKSPGAKYAFIAFSFISALISLTIPAAYLSDLIGENPDYAQFRSLAYAELLVSLAAPFAAIIFVWLASYKKLIARPIYLFGLFVTLTYISIPFIKPLIRPLPQNINNQWLDGVALQTTKATCGPASLATVMSHYGDKNTEANIAKQAFSSSTGTENWYLARYARQQGYQYHFLREYQLNQVPTPSIIGVKLGKAGHFITLLSRDNGHYIVADSLSGLHKLTLQEFNQRYQYNGFVLHLNKI